MCPTVRGREEIMECALVASLEELSKLCGKSTDAQRDIAELQMELSGTKDKLRTLGMMLEKPSMQEKLWTRQVREMLHDFEDWVDDLRRQTEGETHNHGRGIKGVMRKMTKMASGDEILHHIRHFTARAKAANSRHEKYQLGRSSSSGGPADPTTSGSVAAPPNPPSSPHCSQKVGYMGDLVGIDGQTKELLDLLGSEEKQVKVVSVVGSGGIGKASLAKKVYGKLQHQFEYRALVSVGRTPSVRTVLKNIIYQVNGQLRDGSEYELIQELKEFLDKKKYFVVIIDVWSLRVYQVIRSAFPENNVGSRVMLTTCSYDLVRSSCILRDIQVVEVKPLNSDDSKTLLTRTIERILDPGSKCPPTQLQEDHIIVLERCGGVPLAIIVMAGVLTSLCKVKRQRELIKSYFNSDEHFGMEDMRNILHICYMTLPHHLKYCFLYFSVFPVKYVIPKSRLIRRWIAEGFISTRGGKSSMEIGEDYCNELVKRSLIQPVSFDHNEHEEGYTVHDMIHEYIISLSVEENFVTLPGQRIPPNMIRRLSLQYKNHEAALAVPSVTVMSHVRSVTIFFGYNQVMPDFSLFQYLRVLALEDADKLQSSALKNIGRLFQLKYLGLGKAINELPEQIGDLKHMQTLDVTQTSVRKLPARVLQLNLLHVLGSNVELPHGLGTMEKIEELSLIDITNSSSHQSVEDLGELKNLRILGVKWCVDGDRMREIIEKSLVSALQALISKSNFQCLSVDVEKGCSLDFLMERLWASTTNIKIFKLLSLNYCFKIIPQGMDASDKLTQVEIGITNVSAALRVLGSLPALEHLKLRSGEELAPKEYIINEDEFRCLKEFWFMRLDGRIAGLSFREKAAPTLENLILQFSIWGAQYLDEDFSLGIRHLSHLKHIHFKMDCEGAGVSNVRAEEKKAMQTAVSHLSRVRHAHGKMYSDGAGVSEIEIAEDAMGGAVNRQPTCEFAFSTHREDKSIQGAFKGNSRGVGAVFKSSSGFFIAAMARSLKQGSDYNIGEAEACQEAMDFALKEGFKRVGFTTDCQPLVTAIEATKMSNEDQHSPYAQIIKKIMELKDLFESFSLKYHQHTTEEANQIANRARDNELQCWTIKDPPKSN